MTLAGLLAIVGLLLVPLADLGIWTQRELLPTDAFTSLATDVLHKPDVQQALAQRLTTELVNREPALAIGRPLVQRAVVEGVGTPQFSQVLQASLGDMHDQLKRGDDKLVLNLDATLPIVKSQLSPIDPRLAASVPNSQVLPSFTVVKRSDAPELWEGVQIRAPMPPISTVGQPGPAIGPPTCGTRTVTIGQTCMSPRRAAGMPINPSPRRCGPRRRRRCPWPRPGSVAKPCSRAALPDLGRRPGRRRRRPRAR